MSLEDEIDLALKALQKIEKEVKEMERIIIEREALCFRQFIDGRYSLDNFKRLLVDSVEAMELFFSDEEISHIPKYKEQIEEYKRQIKNSGSFEGIWRVADQHNAIIRPMIGLMRVRYQQGVSVYERSWSQ